jgi:ATP-dependent Clp protease ATP-binding subunit ClpA
MKTPRASKKAAPPPLSLPTGVEVDLVQLVVQEPPLHGLDEAVTRLASLIGVGRRHPVLVGPHEVGKTALVRGLARRIADGARPGGASAIWQVSLRTLEGQGGKDEGIGVRLARILREAAESPARPIVFVRDLRALRAYDAQHQLIEALTHANALFIGEALPSFGAWLADDPELAGVTHLVRVEEASPARTLALLEAEAELLATRENIKVEPGALERIVRYAERLMPQRRFPGKAFALLDEAVREVALPADRRLTAAGVTTRVCEVLRLPRFLIDPDTPFDADDLRGYLRARVVGQEDAIDALVQSLALYKADLADPKRPIGVLLFAGPAGVGKTLLARLVAEYVFGSASRLVRIPMAEYAEDWKVDQLFGQRGTQSLEGRRGVLARQMAGKPFSVLLLDEIEKAHPLAYRHLLRPFDEGVFVNGADEEISLRNALVILTSNVGSEVYREPGLGFAPRDAVRARAESVRKRVMDMFPLDLLDRVDRVSVCPPLGGDDMLEVARRELHAALERAGIRERHLEVEVDDAVLAHVIADGIVASHANGSGARAVRRALERTVVAPLAMYLLREQPSPGTQVRVTVQNGVIVPTGVPVASAAAVAPMPVAPVATGGPSVRGGRVAAPAGTEASAGERVSARRSSSRSPRE